MNENDVQNIMKNDLTMIGTDGIDVGSKPSSKSMGYIPENFRGICK